MPPPAPPPDPARLYQLLTESAPDAIVVIDEASTILSVNPAMERLSGHAAAELVGRSLTMLMPERLRAAHRAGMERYVATGERRISWQGMRVAIVTRGGAEIPVEIAFGELRSGGRRIFAGFLRDLSDRLAAERAIHALRAELARADEQLRQQAVELEHQVEEAQLLATELEQANTELRTEATERQALHARETDARRDVDAAHRRATFLAEASALLASSLDYQATLAHLARLTVPHLADWCVVSVLDGDVAPDGTIHGTIRDLAIAHANPTRVAWARQLARRYPPHPSDAVGVTQVLRTGISLFQPAVSDRMLARSARDAEHLRLLREVGLTSVIIVPMLARGAVLGALTMVTAESGRRYSTGDLVLAEELARRAAVAVDNARLFRDAEQARAAAESANRAKSDFLATMSHEIRTPINAILGYNDLLEMGLFGPLTEAQREQLSRVGASTRHLLGLVNEVLDLARVESGTMHVERAQARAGETVDTALSLVRPQAAAKGITLAEQCGGEREAPYLGDEHRVRQVVTNLLMNAVKFTQPGGRIVVECAVEETPPPDVVLAVYAGSPAAAPVRGGRWVAIRVEDSGVGIAPEQLARIFEPFTQATDGYTRQAGGVGLGLTISRRLARLMGGDLTVESMPGAGSVFTLWLPASAEAAPHGVVQLSAGANGASGAREETPERTDAYGAGLGRIGQRLVAGVSVILDGWLARMRAEPAFPHVHALDDAQLLDHGATFLSDIGLALVALAQAGGEPAELMRDGTEILRVIAERHGAQRCRIGWEEDDIRREFVLLSRETEDAVRRAGAGESPAVVDEAQAVVTQLLAHAERVSVRSHRATVQTA